MTTGSNRGKREEIEHKTRVVLSVHVQSKWFEQKQCSAVGAPSPRGSLKHTHKIKHNSLLFTGTGLIFSVCHEGTGFRSRQSLREKGKKSNTRQGWFSASTFKANGLNKSSAVQWELLVQGGH